MNVVWDGDTGTVTVTASTATGAVNLSGSSARHVIARNKATGTAAELTAVPADSDLPNGIVAVTAPSEGTYDIVMHVTDSDGTIVTYPSADIGAARLVVRADIDA